MKTLLLAAAAAAAILASTPASAAQLLFTITNVGGENRGDYSFQLDTDRNPSIVLADSVRYQPLTVTYANVPGQGSGTISTGVTFFAPIQQGGLMLGFLPFGNFRLINTALIENTSFNPAAPLSSVRPSFRLGTFAISTTPQNNGPRPFDNYRITIAAVPEPASWAMMLMGFGALGVAVRRRGAKITYA
jgi:hypothetical protein